MLFGRLPCYSVVLPDASKLAVMFRRVFITALVPLTASAQGSVAPDVESVVSGGYWEDGAQSGRYRVVLVNSGFERVTSRLRVEWVREPRSADASPGVVASSEPRLPFGQCGPDQGLEVIGDDVGDGLDRKISPRRDATQHKSEPSTECHRHSAVGRRSVPHHDE